MLETWVSTNSDRRICKLTEHIYEFSNGILWIFYFFYFYKLVSSGKMVGEKRKL